MECCKGSIPPYNYSLKIILVLGLIFKTHKQILMEDKLIRRIKMKKVFKKISSGLVIALFLLSIVSAFFDFTLPDEYLVEKGNSLELSCGVSLCAKRSGKTVMSDTGSSPLGEKYTLRLFNLIPVKEVNVRQVERMTVIPGGNPFGIRIVTDGVVVIGITDVDTSAGSISPARLAGLRDGDIIKSINGTENVTKEAVLKAFLNSKGEKINMTVRRESKILTITIEPKYSLNDNCYKAGMWVRDSAAGIGTITYYEPQTGIFGGLGHPICDCDTGTILPIKAGQVIGVKINGVNKGMSGQPGELVGVFTSDFSMGKLTLNNQCGLFGYLNSVPNNNKPVEIAFKQEIKEGKAKILTTLDGVTPKEYDIEIERVTLKGNEQSKNMIIHITDEELLSKTGGIVQGMSGSPIIQDGRLVGAVTHVFVNDPERGYGIFVENMIHNSESLRNMEKVS